LNLNPSEISKLPLASFGRDILLLPQEGSKEKSFGMVGEFISLGYFVMMFLFCFFLDINQLQIE